MESMYECVNGIVGMKRDVVMRLIGIIGRDSSFKEKIDAIFGIDATFFDWRKTKVFQVMRNVPVPRPPVFLALFQRFFDEPKKIRTIMGICKEQYIYKTYPFFVKSRPVNILASFRPNPMGGIAMLPNKQASFGADCRTVFLDRPVITGETIQWTININYADGKSSFHIGVAPANSLKQCDKKVLGNAVGCSFGFWKSEDGSFGLNMIGAEPDTETDPLIELIVTNGSLVTVEVSDGTMALFVNEELVPAVIRLAHTRPPLHLGVTGVGGPSFTSVAVRRCHCPSYVWGCSRFSEMWPNARHRSWGRDDEQHISQIMEATHCYRSLALELYRESGRNVEETISMIHE